MPLDDALLTFEQTRARLNMSERFVRSEVANGNLPAHRFGNKILRFDPADVEAYIDARKIAKPKSKRAQTAVAA
jgi:excisionase family DNA binding protein